MGKKVEKRTITEDLKELAKVKLKADTFGKLYDDKIKELKKRVSEENIGVITDPDNILKLNFNDSGRRMFSIEGVRKILGDKASICIEEKIIPDKFDSIAKINELTEDQKKTCFIKGGEVSASWDGLDIYKRVLLESAKKKNE